MSSGSRPLRRRSARGAASPRQIEVGPLNTAVYSGSTALLECAAASIGLPRVQWWEYVTNPGGAQITDDDQILPGHPYASRYTLYADLATLTYNLGINSTFVGDGGLYKCEDHNDASALFAELVIIGEL